MKNSYKLFIAISTFITFSSCELYNPAEPVPSYIHIEKITLVTAVDGSQGSNSSKIADAWVYIDDQLIGCFELPATFPVTTEGPHQIKVIPGIKVNGIAATRAPYPFYSSYEQAVDLKKTGRIVVNPIVHYSVSADFDFIENFENAGIILSKSPASGVDTIIQRIFSPDPNVFEANSSGIAYLDATHTFFECVSNTSYNLPKAGAPVFLEFNYKCNHEFAVGIYAHSSAGTIQTAALTFNPSATWNKTYLYLTPVVSSSTNATDFNIFFGMINTTGADSIALLLDNIKLVH